MTTVLIQGSYYSVWRDDYPRFKSRVDELCADNLSTESKAYEEETVSKPVESTDGENGDDSVDNIELEDVNDDDSDDGLECDHDAGGGGGGGGVNTNDSLVSVMTERYRNYDPFQKQEDVYTRIQVEKHAEYTNVLKYEVNELRSRKERHTG